MMKKVTSQTRIIFPLLLTLTLVLSSCGGKGNLLGSNLVSGQGDLGGGDESCSIEGKKLNGTYRKLSSNSSVNSLEEIIEGDYQKVFVDNFEHSDQSEQKEDVFRHYLITEKKKIFQVITNSNDSISLNSIPVGTKIRLTGQTIEQGLQINDQGESESTFLANQMQIISSNNNPDILIKDYSLKTLMVIMNFTNRVTSNVYPLSKGKTDLKDIADYYRRVSGNQINMITDVNGDGEQDVEVVTMGTSYNTSYCTPFLDTHVTNKLVQHNLQDYNTVIFVAAQTTSGNDPVCGYGGVANVGMLGSGLNGRTHVGIPLNSVTVHELGHTYGLGHSGRDGCTYCDQVDPMGNYFGNLFQYFNGPKIKQLGLFDNRTELEHNISSSGIYPISAVGIGMKSENTTPRLLTVAGATPYYLTYRHTSGEDADLPSSLNGFKGIVVNTGSLGNGGQSVYHKVLKTAGETYTAGNLTVRLISGISNPEAEVEVIINGSSGNPTPAPQPKCVTSKVVTTLQSVNKTGYNLYEIAYEVDNQNTGNCSKLNYSLALQSSDLELSEASSFEISSGQKLNIITKFKVKSGIDLKQVRESSGVLIGSDHEMKLGDFSIPFTKTVGGETIPDPGC